MDGTPDIHVPKHTVCNSFYVILNKNNSYLSGNASIFHCKLNFSISTGIIANDCISKQNVSFLYTCLGISFTSSSSQWSFSRFLSGVTLYFKNIVFKTYFPLKIFQTFISNVNLCTFKANDMNYIISILDQIFRSKSRFTKFLLYFNNRQAMTQMKFNTRRTGKIARRVLKHSYHLHIQLIPEFQLSFKNQFLIQ